MRYLVTRYMNLAVNALLPSLDFTTPTWEGSGRPPTRPSVGQLTHHPSAGPPTKRRRTGRQIDLAEKRRFPAERFQPRLDHYLLAAVFEIHGRLGGMPFIVL